MYLQHHFKCLRTKNIPPSSRSVAENINVWVCKSSPNNLEIHSLCATDCEPAGFFVGFVFHISYVFVLTVVNMNPMQDRPDHSKHKIITTKGYLAIKRPSRSNPLSIEFNIFGIIANCSTGISSFLLLLDLCESDFISQLLTMLTKINMRCNMPCRDSKHYVVLCFK